MSKKIKIASIGGGSSYTPELVEGFIKRSSELPISEIWFVDIEEGKEKLEIVGGLAKRMVEEAGLDWKIHLTLDREEALKDADFVTTQFRVGLLDARIKDERIPLSYGMLGQETNGAGGILKAFRTIPVILEIVEDMKRLCPKAWLINFTNPAGMVTEAVINYGKFDRVVGLCNVPIVHEKMESAAIEKEPTDLFFHFAGINHYHWHKIFDKQGHEITKQVIKGMFEEKVDIVENIFNIPFLQEHVESMGIIPCAYHRYYYLKDDMLKEMLEDYKKNETRAEVVKATEAKLFELYKDPNLKHKPEELTQRGGTYYSDAACEMIASLHNDKRNVMVVNTKNNGAIVDLDPNSIIEISSLITSAGPKPIAFGKLPSGPRSELQKMKGMEELVIKAAITGDYNLALEAFMSNPLIESGHVTKKLLDEMLIAHKDYLPQFADKIVELENK